MHLIISLINVRLFFLFTCMKIGIAFGRRGCSCGSLGVGQHLILQIQFAFQTLFHPVMVCARAMPSSITTFEIGRVNWTYNPTYSCRRGGGGGGGGGMNLR